MNINTVRTNLQTAIQSTYTAGLSVKDTQQMVRSEMNAILDDIIILEKELPPVSGDPVYTETCRFTYEEIMKYWIANTDNLFEVIEVVKQLRFTAMTSSEQMWTRLLELAKYIDLHATYTRKESFLKYFGVQRKRCTQMVEGMHPSKLEEYRKANSIALAERAEEQEA